MLQMTRAESPSNGDVYMIHASMVFLILFFTFSSQQMIGAEAREVQAFREVIKTNDVAVYSQTALALRRWMMAHDLHYPTYHFTGPESWINDPNGPIFYKGRYHLFYQYDPIVDGRRSLRCWGHAVSTDLVHWVDWPVALWPDMRGDMRGVWSGNTFVDDRGALCALYTGNAAAEHKETYGVLARTSDGGLTWQKKVVMEDAKRPNADSPVHWDGFTWKEGNTWCQLIGGTSGGSNKQGVAWMWNSPDLEHWTLRKNIAPTIKYSWFWELPYLINLGDRQVLFVGASNPYWVGSYDKASMIFKTDNATPCQIDTGRYYSFNLNMTDRKGQDGRVRQIMHGWVTCPPTPTKTVPYWEGAHSIPRVLSLKGDRVWQEPIPELQALRTQHQSASDFEKAVELLKNIKSDAAEILATFQPDKIGRFGLRVRVAKDGASSTEVAFDSANRAFSVQGRDTEKTPGYQKGFGFRTDSALASGLPVTLHVFVDRSIIEVYVNGMAGTALVYAPADAIGLELFTEPGAGKLTAFDIWQMQSMWGQN